MQEQVLDDMDLERERGITIKARACRMNYKAKNGQEYMFNLIDTPGHVDFAYEVSRSLAACEGALLVVDASQGIEAQTLANVYMAMSGNLELIPVINKIDLPSADADRVAQEVEDVIGLPKEMAIKASAKAGIGIEDILEAVVEYVPAPKDDDESPLRALVFDSWFDSYQGVIVLVRVFEGSLKVGNKVRLFHAEKDYEVLRLGVLSPRYKDVPELTSGQVGCIICGIKTVRDVQIGETVTLTDRICPEPLPGFTQIKPMVFSGIYPVETEQYQDLKDALEKLRLNDSSFTYEPETSTALGFGFRCGFLGLLHMEIVQERLEREFNLNLITTAPSVIYRVVQTDGTVVMVDNPAHLPPTTKIEYIEEPYIKATIHCPEEYIGVMIKLCEDKRGIQQKIDFITKDRVAIVYELPLNEMVFDFYDRLKSSSRGYASLDYELVDYRKSDLVKLDILLNSEPVDALSIIVHRDKAFFRGRELTKKLKELIERQMYEVAIQAAIGGKIVARETLSALRKNVLAKCYGGDISRKRKLLEKQKEGKKRMKSIGSVEVPQEAFLAVLKIGDS